VLTTYLDDTGDEPIALCAVGISHDENGILEQRNYFPALEEGFELLIDDVASWAGELGVPLHTVELGAPETCSCCGDLAGHTLDAIRQPTIRREEKVGRNALCPCESGKKYKHCCGA